MKKYSNVFVSSKTYSKLEQLYSDAEVKRKAREIGRMKKILFFICIIATLVISGGLFLADKKRNDTPIKFIERNGYGKGDKNVSTVIQYDANGDEEEISIVVKEKRYSDEELDKFFEEIQIRVWDEILGDNKSLDEVTTDLNLVTSIEKFPYRISWKSEKPLLISSKGKVDKKRIKEEFLYSGDEEIQVQLVATLTYDDRTDDLYGYVILKEDKTKSIEKFWEEVRENIEIEGDRTRTNERQNLPEKIGDVNLTYYPKKQYRSLIVLVVGIVCSFGLMIGKDKEFDKEIRKRNEELKEDYPRILNQYVLFYCAGMNHRAIWEEICSKYEKRALESGKRRCAYEEMIRCKRSMDEGKGELASYDDFAKRCHESCYRVFISLVEQSVKRGSERLDIALYEELDKARREENNRVRVVVQEMSTKLLLPMIMMLLVVLIIVMVPAFISFK